MNQIFADINPPFECLIRTEYFKNCEPDAPKGFTPAVVFGVMSYPNNALGFSVMTEQGAIRNNLPISALVHREDAPEIPFHSLQLWDCFDTGISIHSWAYLEGKRCSVMLKDKKWYEGIYEFSFGWDYPVTGNLGHKELKFIKLDCGLYAAQPNNRIQFYDPAYVTKPFIDGDRPNWAVDTGRWQCESHEKWTTEATNSYHYGVISPSAG